ncbi:MAG: hypothetical protein, partial [Olavius algarvensis Gamma 1 endosymbiont]
MRTCPTPTENFPYRTKTFDLIRRIAPDIKRFSARYNRLVPVDNSLIFINFMSLLRAKRTDSLTNRFF